MLWGSASLGKSYFVVGLAKALTSGEPEFLGRKVSRKVGRVAVGCTDPGGAAEAADRFVNKAGGDASRLKVVSLNRYQTGDLAYWRAMLAELQARRWSARPRQPDRAVASWNKRQRSACRCSRP